MRYALFLYVRMERAPVGLVSCHSPSQRPFVSRRASSRHREVPGSCRPGGRGHRQLPRRLRGNRCGVFRRLEFGQTKSGFQPRRPPLFQGAKNGIRVWKTPPPLKSSIRVANTITLVIGRQLFSRRVCTAVPRPSTKLRWRLLPIVGE